MAVTPDGKKYVIKHIEIFGKTENVPLLCPQILKPYKC